MVKNLSANAGDTDLTPGSARSLEKEMAAHSIPVFLPGKSYRQKSLGEWVGVWVWVAQRSRIPLPMQEMRV